MRRRIDDQMRRRREDLSRRRRENQIRIRRQDELALEFGESWIEWPEDTRDEWNDKWITQQPDQTRKR